MNKASAIAVIYLLTSTNLIAWKMFFLRENFYLLGIGFCFVFLAAWITFRFSLDVKRSPWSNPAMHLYAGCLLSMIPIFDGYLVTNEFASILHPLLLGAGFGLPIFVLVAIFGVKSGRLAASDALIANGPIIFIMVGTVVAGAAGHLSLRQYERECLIVKKYRAGRHSSPFVEVKCGSTEPKSYQISEPQWHAIAAKDVLKTKFVADLMGRAVSVDFNGH